MNWERWFSNQVAEATVRCPFKLISSPGGNGDPDYIECDRAKCAWWIYEDVEAKTGHCKVADALENDDG